MADEDASLDNDSAETSGAQGAVEDRTHSAKRQGDEAAFPFPVESPRPTGFELEDNEATVSSTDSRRAGFDPPDFDEAAEDRFWAEAYGGSPYLRTEWDYKVFQPACRYGWQSFRKFYGRTFEEVEAELKTGWELHRGESGPHWAKAREAARGAWNRVERVWRRRYGKP